VPLQQEVDGSGYGEQTKDDEQCQLHDAPRIPLPVNRLNHLKQRELLGLPVDCKAGSPGLIP
jgi:hypothetical protein